MFEMRSIDEVVRIVEAGGGVVLAASMKRREDLVRIAQAAARSGAKVTLQGLGMRGTDEIVEIASAGGGNVIFDDARPKV